MSMKKTYKELRESLSGAYSKRKGRDYYSLMDGVGHWLKQSGIRPTPAHLEIICNIFKGVPYPYQRADRLRILGYLKKNKFKHYKKQYGTK